MSAIHYYDPNGQPIDMMTWATNFDDTDRVVAKTQIGDVEVSTVWLGLDHQYGAGPPLIFETMIFGGDEDGYQERYSTRRQAEAGHQVAVRLVKR